MVDQGPVERRALGHYTCSYHLKSYYLLSPAILPAILPVILPVVLLVILLVILPVTFRMTPSSKIPASPPHTRDTPFHNQKPVSHRKKRVKSRIPPRDTHFSLKYHVSIATHTFARFSPYRECLLYSTAASPLATRPFM